MPDALRRSHTFGRTPVELAEDFAHHVEQSAELIGHVFGSGDTDAVFGRERSFELFYQGGGLIGDLSKLFEIIFTHSCLAL